ncbi:hypothetical protein V6N13_018045 [Hibiscus sabdariffa]|uniref:Uncharacterized protein n=1 Tax=Hibiscus sabdariffa TaxID=183260 RepID=A0ABR2CGK8_9ROSI
MPTSRVGNVRRARTSDAESMRGDIHRKKLSDQLNIPTIITIPEEDHVITDRPGNVRTKFIQIFLREHQSEEHRARWREGASLAICTSAGVI